MMQDNDMKNMPQMWHRAALQAGLSGTIPIIPVDGELHEHTKVDPKARGKVPGDYYGGAWDGMGGWPEYEMTLERATKWDDLRANVGLGQGIVYASLDVDVMDDTLAATMRAWIEEQARLAGAVWPIRVGQAPKFLVMFRVHGDPIKRKQYPFKRDGVEGRELVEVMGVSSKGRPTQAVIFGTHPSGSQYTWNRSISHADLPVISQAGMDALVAGLAEVAAGRGYEAGRGVSPSAADGTGSELGAEPVDQSLIPEVVKLIDNQNLEYDDWIAVGYAIKAAAGAPGWQMFAEWSAKAPKNDPNVTARMWNGFKPDGSTGMGKLVFLARQTCGGKLPGDLDERIRKGVMLKSMEKAGMPMVAPIVQQGVDPSYAPPETPNAAPPTTDKEWIDLVCNDKGEPYCNMVNMRNYLNNSDQWNKCFAYDSFNDRIVILSPMPRDEDRRVPRWLEDKDYAHVHGWFQQFMWPKAGKTDIIDAVNLEASKNRFEPVQEYLRDLTWDGVPRIDNWLFEYGGVDINVDPFAIHYTQQVSRKWLIAGVARAIDPGCQVDNALILEGGQGKGKSSLFRALMPDADWFTDGLPDFHSKDASEHLMGKWVTEMSELTTVHKGMVEDMRKFLSRRVEQFRPSYARQQVTRPRRVVFCGTTNRRDYLKDTAGERRMWILECVGKIRIADLKLVRDQLWAEAMVAYQAGEVWHLDEATEAVATQVQQERVAEDPWIANVEQAISHLPEVYVSQVMLLLGMDLNVRSKANQSRIIQCLEQLGYTRGGRCSRTGRTMYSKS